MRQICRKCGVEFSYGESPQLKDALNKALSDAKSYWRPAEELYVYCTNCGARQIAIHRRYFGILKPIWIQLFLFLVISGAIIIIIYVLLTRINGS